MTATFRPDERPHPNPSPEGEGLLAVETYNQISAED